MPTFIEGITEVIPMPSIIDPTVDILIGRTVVALTAPMDVRVMEMTLTIALPVISIIVEEGEV